MSTAKWTPYNTADTAIAGASLNALASGSYALGSAIDNTSGLYLYGDLEIVLSSAITAGSGAPYLDVYVLPSMNGTNYPTTNGGTTAGLTAMQYLAGSISPPASTNVTVMHVRGLVLGPFLFKIMIRPVLGVAFPGTDTNTCKLYRYGEQAA